MHRTVILLLLVFTYLQSCDSAQKQSHNHPESDYSARITLSAGDLHPMFNSVEIPAFFNLGEILLDQENAYETIILGERVNNNSKIPVNPLALLSFEMDTIMIKIIVSTQMGNQSELDTLDYNAFMLNHPYLTKTIEHWFMLQCSANQCRNFKWENTYKTLLELANRSGS
ncbi:MAG: hypothetical protein HKN09_00730 [Saprospiraceae bacterium]|nr:hypothetical protein [Saprospiraceae bacterium]